MAGRSSFEGADGSLRLGHGLRVDHLGDERIVLDAARGVVHTLRGDAATTLDAVLRGVPVPDSEALQGLARAGIVVGAGIPRRDLLAASGLASALLISTALPSAAAAATNLDGDGDGGVATVVGTSTLVTEYAVNVGGVDYQLFRIAHDDFLTSLNTNIVREIRLSAAREVDVLLVGGGGGGGNIDTSNTGFRTGGGGAGEVHQVSLGVVAANAILDVTVGGRVSPGTSGLETTVAIDGTTLAQATGGGRGAGNGTAVADGGSGGGGRSSAVELERAAGAAGSAGTGGGSSERNAGAAGDAEDGGGGGGAGGAGGAAGAGGGAGGAADDIAAFLGTWDGVGSANPLDHRYVAGGGGGGSDTSAGGAGGAAGGVTVGGRGVRRSSFDDGGDLRHGVLGTGSGGGGGAANGISSAAGSGADGVAWIRVKVAEPT